MKELKWKDAIEKVLEEEKKALHYTEIAELISNRGYRFSLGATPQDTVSANLSVEIKSLKEHSKFVRVSPGYFILRKFIDKGDELVENGENQSEGIENTKLDRSYNIINNYGIYWNRNQVYWKSTPDLLGVQQQGATQVNFKDQIGIYLLHDSRETIYVGQAIDQSLGKRLKDHMADRLSGRWDRFSWFGFYPVNEDGTLLMNIKFQNISLKELSNVLEAVLIESIEPRQNRKQGNLFSGLEYLQKKSDEIEKKLKQQLLKELGENL